ncbi:hypothetical protein F511_19140 [Dorcoceras hygrometricum]|uniref:Uncharacterized protein n=1 Tax=Dorcoceras hygrometricum TaxID=472368 RepID=A0A2Z7BCS1_9LAMI|nr:hypothetical protein F511_19140 [Dorcoceras hygrometricum]
MDTLCCSTGLNCFSYLNRTALLNIELICCYSQPSLVLRVYSIVQASVAANTWVVSGSPQTKKLQDILPQIIHQLGPDNLENLKKLAEQFQKQVPAAGEGGTHTGVQEDDVPDLVAGQTFEAAAEESHTSWWSCFLLFSFLVSFFFVKNINTNNSFRLST